MIATLIISALLFLMSSNFGCQCTNVQVQEDISCMLKDNTTARCSFFNSVLSSRHGITTSKTCPGNKLRTIAVQQGGTASQMCFNQDQDQCLNSNFISCFNLHHPTELIEICWSSQGTVINSTESAKVLELEKYFTVGNNCRGKLGRPCVAIHSAPFFLEAGILTCTLQNETCSAKSFSRIMVFPSTSTGYHPEAIYHNKTNKLVLGEQNIYYFTAEIPSNLIPWYVITSPVAVYESGTYVDSIPESPFCDEINCSRSERAGSSYNEQKQQRIRVYSFLSFIHSCPHEKYEFHTWLVIDDAQEYDADLDFMFEVSIPLTLLPQRIARDRVQLNLTAVPPFIDILPIEVPTVVSTMNDSISLGIGNSVEWVVSAQAGISDRLVWTIDGQELPAVTDIQSDKDFLCSQYNGTYYLLEAKTVSQFVRNFTATLFLCNITHTHFGYYECSVSRSQWEPSKLSLWSTQISEPNTQQTQTTSDDRMNLTWIHMMYIAVGVFVTVLVVTAALILVIMVVCIRRLKQKRRFRSRRTLRRSSVAVQSFSNCTKMHTGWNLADIAEQCSGDEFEFPRERLIFMDKVLGKGAFGLVLLAKAEGIVRDSPNRNIVAVKTYKETPRDNEVNSLWQELEIMKRIKPHPHLVNLLGYSRQSASGSLYLIVEFAMYGNLQTFLKECADVVSQLNHAPRVVNKNEHSQWCTSCSYSSSIHNSFPQKPSSNLDSPSSASSYVDVSNISIAESELYESPYELTLNHQEVSSYLFQSCALAAKAANDSTTAAAVTHDYINSKGFLHMEDVQNFALQIASGLKHLEEQKIVHCDLAARNILISEGFILKIGDFGMAREISEKEYYHKTEGRIPVKWTAPEVLEEHIFTHKSDVWSFGIVLWEIFSYGHRPYSEIKVGQSWDPFIQALKDGKRPSQPAGCPDIFYELMQRCWCLNPEERPTATELVDLFETYTDSGCDGYLPQVAQNTGETEIPNNEKSIILQTNYDLEFEENIL